MLLKLGTGQLADARYLLSTIGGAVPVRANLPCELSAEKLLLRHILRNIRTLLFPNPAAPGSITLPLLARWLSRSATGEASCAPCCQQPLFMCMPHREWLGNTALACAPTHRPHALRPSMG